MVFPWKNAHNEKIFINYCRDDAGGFAGRLSDILADYFGRDRIFRDVTDINYGHDFEQVIDQKLSESGAVVVLIDEKWISVTNKEGKRRLDDPSDYVSRGTLSRPAKRGPGRSRADRRRHHAAKGRAARDAGRTRQAQRHDDHRRALELRRGPSDEGAGD